MKFKSILFLSCAFFAVSQITYAQTDEYYEKALKSYNNKDRNAAYLHLKNALHESPEHLPSKILMGRVLLHKGNVDAARQELEDAIAQGADPNLTYIPLTEAYTYLGNTQAVLALSEEELSPPVSFELKLLKGGAYAKLKNKDEAIRVYREALTLYPNNIRGLNSLAAQLIVSKRISEAEAIIETALNHSPSNPRTLHLLGEALESKGKVTEALQAYQQAHELSPENPVLLRSLANAYLNNQNNLQALRIVEQILRQTPDDPFALLLKGRINALENNYAEAKSAFDEVVQKLTAVPKEAQTSQRELILADGLANYLVGNYEGALSQFERYHSFSEDNENALSLYISTLLKIDKPRKAIDILEARKEFVASSQKLTILLCDLYIKIQKPFKCETLSAQLDEKFGPSPFHELIKIKLLRATDNTSEALEALQASDVDLQSRPFSTQYIELLIENQRTADALEHVKTLNRKFEDDMNFKLIEAQIYLSLGNIEQAINGAKTVVDELPSDKQANLTLLRAYLAIGDYDQAEDIAAPLSQAYPSDPIVSFLLGQTFYYQNKFEQALSILLKAKDLDKSYPLPSELLAKLYGNLEQWSDARKELEDLTRRNRLQPDYHIALASVLSRQNKFEKAKSSLDLVYGIWLEDPENLVRLSQHQRSIDDLAGAKKSLHRAYSLSADNLSIALPYADILIETEAFKEAGIVIERFLALYPSSSNLHTRLANLEYKKGNATKAIPIYRHAFQLEPRNTTALTQLYQMAVNGEGNVDFEALAIENLEQRPDFILLRRLLADFYLQTKQPNLALEHYKILEQSQQIDNKASIYNNLAVIHTDSDLEVALDYATKAVDLSDQIAAFLDTKAWILNKLKRYDEAVVLLRDAYTVDSSNPSINYHLAAVLANLDRKKEARHQLQRALDSKEFFEERADAEKLLTQL